MVLDGFVEFFFWLFLQFLCHKANLCGWGFHFATWRHHRKYVLLIPLHASAILDRFQHRLEFSFLLNIAKHNLHSKMKLSGILDRDVNFPKFNDRFSLRHCPHRLSLLHCLFKEYCTCPQQVSFFFTWFLTKVLKCVEFKFLRPNFFCWFLLFHFSSHDFLTKRVSSNQKRLTKVGWHAI